MTATFPANFSAMVASSFCNQSTNSIEKTEDSLR
jgi:hypothetical protein